MVQTELGTDKSISKMVSHIRQRTPKLLIILLPVNWGGVVHTTLGIINELSKACSRNYIKLAVIKPLDKYSLFIPDNVMKLDVLRPIIFRRDKPLLSIFNIQNLYSILYNSLIINKLLRAIERISLRHKVHLALYLAAPYPHLLLSLKVLKKFKDVTIMTVHAIFPEISIMFKRFGVMNTLIYIFSLVFMRIFRPKYIITHTISDKIMYKYIISKDAEIYVSALPLAISKTLPTNHNYCSNVKKRPMVLYFGYVIPGKGIEILLSAIRHVISKIPNVLFVVAGQGDIPSEKIKTIPRSNFIHIKNYIPEKYISKLFKCADIVVLPYTFHKGFSGVLRLAIDYEVPILASEVGDLPELIRRFKAGMLFRKGDSKDLAQKIIEILSNKELYTELKLKVRYGKRILLRQTRYIDIILKILGNI